MSLPLTAKAQPPHHLDLAASLVQLYSSSSAMQPQIVEWVRPDLVFGFDLVELWSRSAHGMPVKCP